MCAAKGETDAPANDPFHPELPGTPSPSRAEHHSQRCRMRSVTDGPPVASASEGNEGATIVAAPSLATLRVRQPSAQLTVDRSRTAFLNMLTFGPSHELCASDSSCVASCESAAWRSRTDARSAAESD